MDRALKITSALYATAALVELLACLVVVRHMVLDFQTLSIDRRQAAVLGLVLAYGVMFVMIYGLAARLLWRRRHRKRLLVLVGISCFGFPIGPILGIISLILLTQPAVRARFH